MHHKQMSRSCNIAVTVGAGLVHDDWTNCAQGQSTLLLTAGEVFITLHYNTISRCFYLM